MSLPGLLAGALDVESNAFLDIQAIFFARFHPTHGPQILYQMPEGSVATTAQNDGPGGSASTAANAAGTSGAPAEDGFHAAPSAAATAAGRGPAGLRNLIDEEVPETAAAAATSSDIAEQGAASREPGRRVSTSRRRSRSRKRGGATSKIAPASEPLFDFEPIKDYIIPHEKLCGRLVACNIRGRTSNARASRAHQGPRGKRGRSSFSSSSNLSATVKQVRSESLSRYSASDIEHDGDDAVVDDEDDAGNQLAQDPVRRRPSRNYRILGFPVHLSDHSRYERNDFRFNLCFVFDATADTRPYEPVVRKVARVLTGLEESSCFLSNERNLSRVYGIIEQLYQDLNQYCESFIALPVAPHTSYIPTANPTTPTAGSRQPQTEPGQLFIASSSQKRTPSVQPSGHQSMAPSASQTGTGAHPSPHLASGSSPSPNRMPSIRGRRRGVTIDSLKRDASASFASSSGSGSPSRAAFVGPSTPDTSLADVTATSTTTSSTAVSDDSELHSPATAADAKLREWENELPHGLGRTVRDAINIKLFPIYPNPPAANDWDVPVALLDLRKRVDANWDLTMAKIFGFIDGINHVKKIAELADADLALTRQCMEHLLYYECIIMIDLFQYSNIYTLRPLIASVATLDSIQRECADYVIRPGKPRVPFAKLLELYARALRPGLTVAQWMEDLDVEALNLDVRRFVSFGVIKGFVRRVHRFPIFSPDSKEPYPLPSTTYRTQQDAHLSALTYGGALGSPLALPPDGLRDMIRSGTHSDDELCVHFGLSWTQLERMLLTLGYGAYALAAQMVEQSARARAQARAEEEARQYSSGSAWAGGGSGLGSGLGSSGSGSGVSAGESGTWMLPGSSGGSGHWSASNGSGSGSGGGGGAGSGASGRNYSIGTASIASQPYQHHAHQASHQHQQQQQQQHSSHRQRYPSDAGWASASSFGAHMSGFFTSQHSGGGGARGSDAGVVPSSDAGGGGGGGGGGAYDRVTGERLPANARPRSPSPVPGTDWAAVYSAARTCGHMGDVQILLR